MEGVTAEEAKRAAAAVAAMSRKEHWATSQDDFEWQLAVAMQHDDDLSEEPGAYCEPS